jgi:prevent-host-death family protein
MAHFSLTDLSNRSGEVVEAAFRGPVEITRRGKRKFVLLTAEDYDRLVRAADSRQAFHADDAPQEVVDMMLAALESGDH